MLHVSIVIFSIFNLTFLNLSYLNIVAWRYYLIINGMLRFGYMPPNAMQNVPLCYRLPYICKTTIRFRGRGRASSPCR